MKGRNHILSMLYRYFNDGSRSGTGIYTWSDSSLYKGEWENDMMNGNGLYIDSTG